MYRLMDSNLNVVILHFRNQCHFRLWLNYSTKSMCYQGKIKNVQIISKACCEANVFLEGLCECNLIQPEVVFAFWLCGAVLSQITCICQGH